MEAASRGAGRVILVEKESLAVNNLRENAIRLKAEQVEVLHVDAMSWLRETPPSAVDIVFVDPPFDADLVQPALELLSVPGVLADAALVYVETARSAETPMVISGWEMHREKVLGDVRMNLFRLA